MAAPPTTAPTLPETREDPVIAHVLAAFIQEAIQRGIATDWHKRMSSWVSEHSTAQDYLHQSQLSTDLAHSQAQASASASPSQDFLVGDDLRERNLSDDEHLSPFVGSAIIRGII